MNLLDQIFAKFVQAPAEPAKYHAWLVDGMIGLVAARRDNNQTRYGPGDVVSVFMHEVGMLRDFEAGWFMYVGEPVWLARDGKIYNDRRMLEMVT